jgi:hypothetical protein
VLLKGYPVEEKAVITFRMSIIDYEVWGSGFTQCAALFLSSLCMECARCSFGTKLSLSIKTKPCWVKDFGQ